MQWLEDEKDHLHETSGGHLYAPRNTPYEAHTDSKYISKISLGTIDICTTFARGNFSAELNCDSDWEALKQLLAEGHHLITQKMIADLAEKIRAGEDKANEATIAPVKRFSLKSTTQELLGSSGFPAELQWPHSKVPGRDVNRLARGNIRTIGELVEHTADELLKIRGFGPMSLHLIETRLAYLGFKLKDS